MWPELNLTTVNCKTTQEMVLGPLSKNLATLFLITAKAVQPCSDRRKKLLGVTVNMVLK